MTLYVYLVVYHQSGRRRVPAHWAILVTNKENAEQGTKYHAVGTPFHGYRVEVKAYDLALTRRQYSVFLLGYIDDGWLDTLAGTARGITAPGASPQPLDPFAGENCQNWVEDFIQYLVDAGAIDSSASDIIASSPRV